VDPEGLSDRGGDAFLVLVSDAFGFDLVVELGRLAALEGAERRTVFEDGLLF
jgi:hypothetical protein